MLDVEVESFGVEVFAVSGGGGSVEKVGGGEDGFDFGTTGFAELGALGAPAFEDFDAIVGEGIVGGGDVDGKIKAHCVKTVIDARGGKDAGVSVFNAKSFAGGGEVLENPFGGFAGIASEEDFDVATSVVDEAFDDASEEVGGEILSFAADTVGAEFMHFELLGLV